MIDWLTFGISTDLLDDHALSVFSSLGDRVLKISAEGEKVWETKSWSSIRSDYNGIGIRCMSKLYIAGSPARTYQSNNAFGSSDIIRSFYSIIDFVERTLNVTLPRDYKRYTCSRIDFNRMYDLRGPIAVKQALNYLRHAETRGSNVTVEGDTVYWQKRSLYQSMKAYFKHHHALMSLKKKESHYDINDIDLLQRLIRFELRLGRVFFNKLKDKGIYWYMMTERELERIFTEYLKKIVGDEMTIQSHDGLQDKFKSVARDLGFTDRMGTQAYNTFNMIKLEGYENVKRAMRRTTFYYHQKIMHQVGLSKADICSGRILEFRRKTLLIDQPVTSWDQLRCAANH